MTVFEKQKKKIHVSPCNVPEKIKTAIDTFWKTKNRHWRFFIPISMYFDQKTHILVYITLIHHIKNKKRIGTCKKIIKNVYFYYNFYNFTYIK